jgi:hypothetical protein
VRLALIQVKAGPCSPDIVIIADVASDLVKTSFPTIAGEHPQLHSLTEPLICLTFDFRSPVATQLLYPLEIYLPAVPLEDQRPRRDPHRASTTPTEKRKEKPSALRSVIAGASAGAVEICKCTLKTESGVGLFESVG